MSPGIPQEKYQDHAGAAQGACIERSYLEGEMRRMELDTFDPFRIAKYAAAAGIAESQAALLLRTFLAIPEPGCEDCKKFGTYERGKLVQFGRCWVHTVY